MAIEDTQEPVEPEMSTTDTVDDSDIKSANAETKSEASKPKNKKKLYIWLGVAVVLVVAIVGLWNWSSTNYFCGSICHSMAPSRDGWIAGEHTTVDCITCHADPGFVAHFKAHLNGVKELFIMITENPSADEIIAQPVAVPGRRCLSCHQSDWDELPATHPTEESQCAVCHRDVIHANEKAHYMPAENEGGE